MSGTTKFIIGAIVTALMAMASHSLFGLGDGFLNRLTSDSEAAIAEAGGSGINVDFVRNPSLQRIAILSGPADAATRERLLAAVRAVPGVKDARWAADEAAPAAEAAPATAEQVATCQTGVDAAIKGKTIQFATGSAAIDPASQALIDTIAASLANCAGTVIEVSGHTDPSGNAAANQTLSEARAKSVVAAMVAKGLPESRFTAKGYGSTKPIQQGRGAAADAANRRIEFAVASTGAAAAAPVTQP